MLALQARRQQALSMWGGCNAMKCGMRIALQLQPKNQDNQTFFQNEFIIVGLQCRPSLDNNIQGMPTAVLEASQVQRIFAMGNLADHKIRKCAWHWFLFNKRCQAMEKNCNIHFACMRCLCAKAPLLVHTHFNLPKMERQ